MWQNSSSPWPRRPPPSFFRAAVAIFDSYLVLSLCLVGAAAGDRPPRLQQQQQQQQHYHRWQRQQQQRHRWRQQQHSQQRLGKAAAEEPTAEGSADALSPTRPNNLFSSQAQVEAAVNALPLPGEGEEEGAINIADAAERRRRQQQQQQQQHEQQLRLQRQRQQQELQRQRWQQRQQQQHFSQRPPPASLQSQHFRQHQRQREHFQQQQQQQQQQQPQRRHYDLDPKRRYSNPGSIDKFDEYGDYDLVDHNRLQWQEQRRRNHHVGRPPPPVRPLRPPRQQHHQQQQQHEPWRQQQQGVRREDRFHPHPGHRFHHQQQQQQQQHFRPQQQQQQTLADTFVRRPHQQHSRPQFHHQHQGPFQHQHQQHQQGPPPPPQTGSKPFAIANSVLKLVGLEALPFVKLIPDSLSPSSPSPPPYPDVDYGDYNSIEADYYADYESGAFYRPPGPPGTLDRVKDWFEGFKPPKDFLKPGKKKKSKGKNRRKLRPGSPPSNRPLDYDQYDLGEDQNLILYGSGEAGLLPSSSAESSSDFDFLDVLNSIRKNETMEVTAKKFFSAAASLGERSGSSPEYMFWTVPTTILAIMGLVYLIGAVGIIAYQNTAGNGTSASAVIPTLIAFGIPVILAFAFVASRASFTGQLDAQQVMRGDFRNAMTQQFDGVDFALDAAFGALSLLGVGWVASIAI